MATRIAAAPASVASRTDAHEGPSWLAPSSTPRRSTASATSRSCCCRRCSRCTTASTTSTRSASGVGMYALARGIYVFWDAAVQPAAGYLSDRTRTRWGRRKPWIISGIPLYAVLLRAALQRSGRHRGLGAVLLVPRVPAVVRDGDGDHLGELPLAVPRALPRPEAPRAGVGHPAGVLHRRAHPRHRADADPLRRARASRAWR